MIMIIVLIQNRWFFIMYVCVCNAVTDRQIRKARDNGASSVEDLSRELKVATCCGRCSDCARKILCEKANSTLIPTSLAVESFASA